jgi:hypothetical protein
LTHEFPGRASKTWLEDGLAYPSFEFFRYKHGPWSAELQNELNDLARCGLLSDVFVSSVGQQLVERWEPVLRSSLGRAMDRIDEVVEQHGRSSGAQLKQLVYELDASPYWVHAPRGVSVSSIPMDTVMLQPKAAGTFAEAEVSSPVLLNLLLDLTTTAAEHEDSQRYSTEVDERVHAILAGKR